MIISRRHPAATEIVGWEEDGNNIIVTHREEIETYQKIAEEYRKNTANGWTKERQFQLEYILPPGLFYFLKRKHPDWFTDDYQLRKKNEFKQWLKTDPLAQQFKIAKDAPKIKGDGIQIIVK
jgi:hypothetical protein